jgi:hypothetical protein
MAAGDVFANVYQNVNSDFTIVQPAADVEICIFAYFADSTSARLGVINSVGNMTIQDLGLGLTTYNTKIFFTNSQYFRIGSAGGTTSNVGYTGIQIK